MSIHYVSRNPATLSMLNGRGIKPFRWKEFQGVDGQTFVSFTTTNGNEVAEELANELNLIGEYDGDEFGEELDRITGGNPEISY